MKEKKRNFKRVIFVAGCLLILTLIDFAYSDSSQPKEIVNITNDVDLSVYPNSTIVSLESSIAVDSQGNWHLVYVDNTHTNNSPSNSILTYEIKYLNSKTSVPVTIASGTYNVDSPFPQTFSFPSIAVDSQDNIDIIYHQLISSNLGAGHYNNVFSIMYVQL